MSDASSCDAQRTTEEHQVERAVDVDAKTPPAAAVVDREAGDLLEPARERVVGGQVGQVGEGGAGTGHGDGISRIPVVRQYVRLRRRGGRHQLAAVGRGGERDRPRAEDHEPAIADLRDELAKPRPERTPGGPIRVDPDPRRTGREEATPVPIGEMQSRGRRRAAQRTGIGIRLGMQDRDVDVGHGLPRTRAGKAVSRRPQSRP